MLTVMILGMLVGAVLGLTGAGGGILAVPALITGLGWPIQQATPVALLAVAGGAAVGAIEAWFKKLVRYRAALLMAACSLPFTQSGIVLAHHLPQRLLTGLFGGVMLLAALRQLIQPPCNNDKSAGTTGQLNPATGRFHWNWPTAGLFAAIGAITGLLTGMLGVGGGFVIVPLLKRFTNVGMHGVVATSLMVVALVSSSGVVLNLLHGVSVPLGITLVFSLMTATGMLLGRYAASHLPARYIQKGFAAVVMAVAIMMLVKASH